MKRQSILFILLLLQVLLICSGCGSSEPATESPAAAAEEAAAVTEVAAVGEAAAPSESEAVAEASIVEESAEIEESFIEEPALVEEIPAEEASEPAAASDVSGELKAASPDELEQEIIESQKAANSLEDVEDVIGIFEGLEDNHTAIFSFDGAETVFYFEDPAVQTVLYEAALGSSYTLSYHFDESLGLNVIYEISE